jgi:hypothetical protein
MKGKKHIEGKKKEKGRKSGHTAMSRRASDLELPLQDVLSVVTYVGQDNARTY